MHIEKLLSRIPPSLYSHYAKISPDSEKPPTAHALLFSHFCSD
jgi:hypothetical protein